jgi:hypothetical protein
MRVERKATNAHDAIVEVVIKSLSSMAATLTTHSNYIRKPSHPRYVMYINVKNLPL